MDLIELSRLQFAGTAMFHFLFIPLTLGLSFIMAIMETIYVMTGKEVYRDMTKFWGKLFGINFALGVTTGITMEFQFGTNWAYYSHYVGDVFGAPLAIEGLMAFFLESTFIGLFFFGWDRLGKRQHLIVTWLTAIGSNLSALWILIANGWMQNPVGAEFNYETMRMEMVNFAEVLFNPVAQVKFVHTVAAGYVTGSMFVLSISAYYLLKNRDIAFARRSFAIATAFGIASILSVIILGDESGYELGDVQKTKLAAIEAEWDTHEAPAGITVIGIPNDKEMATEYGFKIPWLLGIIATRSLSEEVEGIKDLKKHHEERIHQGIIAYDLLQKLRADQATEAEKAYFDEIKKDLGYGLLLLKYTDDPTKATTAQIHLAIEDSIPYVPALFWAFRVMVFSGFFMLLVFAIGFFLSVGSQKLTKHKWFLRIALFSIPLPWIASEAGWVVAEFGRQPWAIGEVLPTHMAVSNLNISDLYFSITGFLVFYIVLMLVELFLMVKFARLGPSSLHTGRYHFEQDPANQKNISIGGGATSSVIADKLVD